MHKHIEWSSNDDKANNKNFTNPWQRPKSDPFRDLILKEEYRSRRLRFELGQTWLRIVPAVPSSPYLWMLGVHALNVPGTLFSHPRTLRHNARSVFDYAYTWLRENDPAALFSKTNKDGIRLLPDPLSVCWVLVETNGRYVARLIQASGYDGSRGGAPGLGSEILRLTESRDETGELMAEPVHPERGVLIAVNKSKAHGAKYPTYSLTVGRQPAPMSAILEKTDPAEIEAICPLEQVIHEVSGEEEWELLAKVVKPKHLEGIRAAFSR